MPRVRICEPHILLFIEFRKIFSLCLISIKNTNWKRHGITNQSFLYFFYIADQTGSDVKTVVTVPDGSTIILGGKLKLNQSKSGSKVPILGDLPLVGLLFGSSGHSDIQTKLYVFVRTEIIRPAEALASTRNDMKRISYQNRAAFKKHENEFQNFQDIPGLNPVNVF